MQLALGPGTGACRGTGDDGKRVPGKRPIESYRKRETHLRLN